LAQFEAVIYKSWARVLNDISEATVIVDTDKCGCDWLRDVRSVRQELVVYRSDGHGGEERVWEGPVVRAIYRAGTVEVQARDMLWWLTKRSSRGRFTDDGQNAVREAVTAITQAIAYDDPGIAPYVQYNDDNATTVTTAVNRHEETYYDTLSDLVDSGVFHTAVGRRILVWDSDHPYGRTLPVRTPDDLDADVSVSEDGTILATRVVNTGNDTYGASTPEPVIVNHAVNPSLESSESYWQVPKAEVIPFDTDNDGKQDETLNLGQHFSWNRVKDTHGSGQWAGEVLCEPPVKPKKIGPEPAVPKPPDKPSKGSMTDAEWKAASAAYDAAWKQYKADLRTYHREKKSYSADKKEYNKRISQYNARLRSYRDAEVVIYSTQQLACHESQVVGANLAVWQRGPRTSKLGLRLVGFDSDGEPGDRAFSEGPPVAVKSTTAPVMLFVKGTVPKDTVRFRVEVYRDTEKTKWPTDDCGFRFDKFGLWDQGRVETWFDGDSKTIPALHGSVDYSWNGAPGASSSQAKFSNPKVDAIYGLVEMLNDNATQRTAAGLSNAAASMVRRLNPAPLVLDVPQDVPLNPATEITMRQLVAGTNVPVVTSGLCRNVQSDTTLHSLTVTEGSQSGSAGDSPERVLVSLVAAPYAHLLPDDLSLTAAAAAVEGQALPLVGATSGVQSTEGDV
jgi:hypothetical protein